MRWDLSLIYGNGSIHLVQKEKTTIWKSMNLSINGNREHLHENKTEVRQKLIFVTACYRPPGSQKL